MIHVTKHWDTKEGAVPVLRAAAFKADDGALPVLVISHFEEMKMRECFSYRTLT